jgi:hypothetical protein
LSIKKAFLIVEEMHRFVEEIFMDIFQFSSARKQLKE